MPTNTWLDIQFGIDLGNPGTSEFYINGVLAGRATNLNLTLAGSAVGLVMAGNDQTSNAGAAGSFYIDDIVVDDSVYPDYRGRIIARQIQPGTPTYDAFSKVGGTAISDVWSDTPYNAGTYATSSTSQSAQTGLLTSFSTTEGSRGTGSIQPGDAIGAVKHAVVAKATSSSGTSCAIRRRINGNNLDFPITLGTNDGYFETPLETDSDIVNLTLLNSSEVGLVQGANTLAQTVEDAWAIAYYVPVQFAATATATGTATPTPTSTAVATGTGTPTATSTPTTTGTPTATPTESSTPNATPTIAPSPTPTPTTVVSLSPTSLSFAPQRAGTTSGAKNVTLKNSGAASLTIGPIVSSGDFAQTNNCGSSLPAGFACTIAVTFTPTAKGTRTGSLTVSDSAPDSPQAVSLTGKGR